MTNCKIIFEALHLEFISPVCFGMFLVFDLREAAPSSHELAFLTGSLNTMIPLHLPRLSYIHRCLVNVSSNPPRNNLPHRLSDNLMIILLLQPTNNNNTHQPGEPTYTNRISAPMDRVIIRNRTPTRTRQRILPHKRPLDLVRRSTPTKTRNHLPPHRPARHPKPQHGIALPPHPVVVVGECPVVSGALEQNVQRASAAGGAVRQGDGD